VQSLPDPRFICCVELCRLRSLNLHKNVWNPITRIYFEGLFQNVHNSVINYIITLKYVWLKYRSLPICVTHIYRLLIDPRTSVMAVANTTQLKFVRRSAITSEYGITNTDQLLYCSRQSKHH